MNSSITNLFAILIIIIMTPFFTGCASGPGTGQRVTIDALSAGVGGTAAYFGGGKDPALTTAGTVGGFVVSEMFQNMAKEGRRKAFDTGVEEGKAIGQQQILQGLWEQSNGLPGSGGSYAPGSSKFNYTMPQRVQNGVIYDMTTVPPQATIPQKILIENQGSKNAGYPAHYEKIQETK